MGKLEAVRERIASYGVLDWGLFVLVTSLVAAVSVFGYAAMYDPNDDWNALSYFSPAQIISADGMVPEVPNTNFEIPSITEDDTVPVELVRSMDCQSYRCPLDSLPYVLNSEWVLMDGGQATTTKFPILEDFSASLTEGSDYIRGEAGLFTRSLRPQPVPDAVLAWSAEQGGGDSVWRIQGTVEPLINNASTVAWETGAFVLVHEGAE